MTIRVAVADDQPLFTTGLEMLIASQQDLTFVGAANTGREAVALVADVKPDVLLMDVRMPDLDGVQATRAISQLPQRSTRVLILTTYYSDELVERGVDAGADGFVVKDTTPEFLLAAIRTVHSGHSVIAHRARPESRTAPARIRRDEAIDALSAREKDVFLLVSRGLSNADIAAAAFISDATVKTHVRNILTKLNLASRVQIVAFAYENGLNR